MARPIQAVIHMGSLRRNLEAMRRLAGNRMLWAVVKADAYGHGLERAVRAFEGADGLAVIDIFDVERARRFGWKKRILLLQGFFRPEDLDVVEPLGAEPVVHNEELIRMLERRAPFRDLRVHVKINSGMNRLGFMPEEACGVINEIGSIQPIASLVERVRSFERIPSSTRLPEDSAQGNGPILFHCDASQAGGKMKIDTKKLGVDYMTMAGHKIYATKGVGILYKGFGTSGRAAVGDHLSG